MKINYQKKLDEKLMSIANENKTPSLLLHSCCAPCSSYVIEYLSEFFSVTIYFYNPNIHPEQEYLHRAAEQKRFISEIKTKNPLKFIEGDYNTDNYYNAIKGYEKEKEGGIRCFKCYELRLEKAAILGKMLNFDYFTTTLSVSPYKNAEKLNEIGEELSVKHSIEYLYADFKKKNGYKRSIELSEKYGLYRQKYCGCVFSANDI